MADEPTSETKSIAAETKPDNSLPVEDTHPAQSKPSESDSEKLSKLKLFLKHGDPDVGYHDWCRILMVIFNETKGSDEGLDLANVWSSKGKKYKGLDEIRRKWESFNLNQENPVTIATLCKMVQDNGGDLKAILGMTDEEFECLDKETIVIDDNSDSSIAADDHTDKPDSVTVNQPIIDASSATTPAPTVDDEVILQNWLP